MTPGDPLFAIDIIYVDIYIYIFVYIYILYIICESQFTAWHCKRHPCQQFGCTGFEVVRLAMVKRQPSTKSMKEMKDHFAHGVVIPQFADLTPDSVAAIKKLYYVPCFELYHVVFFHGARVSQR